MIYSSHASEDPVRSLKHDHSDYAQVRQTADDSSDWLLRRLDCYEK